MCCYFFSYCYYLPSHSCYAILCKYLFLFVIVVFLFVLLLFVFVGAITTPSLHVIQIFTSFFFLHFLNLKLFLVIINNIFLCSKFDIFIVLCFFVKFVYCYFYIFSCFCCYLILFNSIFDFLILVCVDFSTKHLLH